MLRTASKAFSIRRFSTNVPKTPTKPFPNEPTEPKIVTSIPGPQSQKLMKEMDKYQDSRTQHFFVDYTKSRGNYLVDADGNVLLDVLCSIASHSVGYNNPRLVAAAKSDEFVTNLINRPALGMLPPTTWPNVLENSLLKVAPKGLNQVFTAMCGSCANECAYKAVFMSFMNKKRSGKAFSEEELTSCMRNEEPGSPQLSILSFSGAFHGRLFGALSTTRSRPLHKIDIPAFNWPMAPFPKLKYPLEQFEKENKAEEDRCLEETRKLIKSHPIPVAGMIIEPIQGEGGDNWASPYFFRSLRKLAKENDVAFIVDEVQTGVGATGKFWAHEHWNLETPPDAVSFAKKMQTTGFYHNIDLRPNAGYRNFNTWMGDPIRALQAREIIKEIEDNNLLENVRITGAFIKEQLTALQKKYPFITNVRGVGTFLAFDLRSTEEQQKFLVEIRQKGVEMTGSGNASIRLRPMLIFAPQHVVQMIERMDAVLKTFPK